MTVSFFVDTRHLGTEEFAMSRGIFPLINRDIIMNHLVQNGVLYHLFR